MSKKQEPYENEGVTLLELNGDAIISISDFFKDTEKLIAKTPSNPNDDLRFHRIIGF